MNVGREGGGEGGGSVVAVTRENSGVPLFTFNGLGISVTTVVALLTANHSWAHCCTLNTVLY